ASEIFRSVITQAELLHRHWLKQWAQTMLVSSLTRAGNVNGASVSRVIAEIHSMGATFPAEVTAEFHLLQGRLDEALQLAGKAASQAEESGRRLDYVGAMELRLRILLRLDRPDDVVALAAET